MKNRRLYHLLFFISFLLFLKPNSSFCQGPPPTANCPVPPCPVIPIDGGISLLLAAGAAYGIKKVYNNNKKLDNQ
jgi:hypothetical protein